VPASKGAGATGNTLCQHTRQRVNAFSADLSDADRRRRFGRTSGDIDFQNREILGGCAELRGMLGEQK